MWTDSLYRLQLGKQVAVDPDKFTAPGQRTLLANIRRPQQESTHYYCDYLLGMKDCFDQVVVLIHNDNLWSAQSIKTYYPDLEVLLDRDNTLLNTLAGQSQFAKQHPTNLLAKVWSFQIVFKGNEIDKFYEIPLENQWQYVRNNLTRENIRHLINTKGHSGVKHLNKLFGQRPQLILESNILGDVRGMYAQLFLYPGLWPNKDIETLKQNKHLLNK